VASIDPQTKPVAIPIEFDVPPSLVTRLATQFTVQSNSAGCYLCFYEAIPPFIEGSPDEVRSQLEQMRSVKAECVSRVFIPAARVSDFLAVVRSVSQSSEAPIEDSNG
jgi:hypothetical protein